jgi:uncharacterized tellurite resistance protein B-like protein
MKQIWADIQAKLGLAETEAASEESLVELATAALLLELCESDQNVDPLEVSMVHNALNKAFGLTEEQIRPLVDRALKDADRNISFHPQVEIINQQCQPEEKAQIVEMLWRVAFADGRLDKYEEHYVRRLCDLIHVPHRVFLQMKHKVEQAG